jgi:hypothetical protein
LKRSTLFYGLGLLVLVGAIALLREKSIDEKYRRLFLGEIVRVTGYKYSNRLPLEPILTVPPGYEKNQFTSRAIAYFSQPGWEFITVITNGSEIEISCRKDGHSMSHQSGLVRPSALKN